MTKLEQLQKHARRYGTDEVMATGVQYGLPREELVELQELCDELDRAKQRWPRKTRLTAEQKVDKLLSPTEEEAKP